MSPSAVSVFLMEFMEIEAFKDIITVLLGGRNEEHTFFFPKVHVSTSLFGIHHCRDDDSCSSHSVCVCGYVRIPMLHAVFHRGGQINDDMSGIKRSKREANKTLLEGSEFYLGRE